MIDTIEKEGIFAKIHTEAEKAKIALKEFVSMDEMNPGDYSEEHILLHVAASRCFFSVAKFLLSEGYNVNAKDSAGNTPLMDAISTGEQAFEMVKLLVEAGADPTVKNNKGIDVIQKAEGARYTEIAEYLREKTGRMNLLDLIRAGNIEEIKKLIKKNPETVNQTFDKRLPLQESIRRGFNDIAELPIKAKADVNALDGRFVSPLHAAAMNEKHDALKLLIANGARINRQAQNGYTLLDHAESRVSPDIINLLKEYGAVKWRNIGTAAPETL